MTSLMQRTWVWVGSGSWWWTGNTGMLQSMGSQRVGHDWETELNWLKCEAEGFPGGTSGKESAPQCRRHGFDPWVRKIPWSRKWQPTPVFLPGKSHGQRSLVGYSLWIIKQSHTTDCLKNYFSNIFCHSRSSFYVVDMWYVFDLSFNFNIILNF